MERYLSSLVLPAFGLAAHTAIRVRGAKLVFGVLGMVYAILGIGFIGCVV